MSGRVNRAAWLLAGALAWGWTWKHLSIEWTTNDQYQYALGVPPLALYLAWRRWRGTFAADARRWPALPLVCAGWATFAFGELLRWHDPIWRLTGALLAAGATLVTIAALYRIGGRALLRRQAFPLLFAWVSVPWPVPLELVVTQNLLHFVTGFTAGVLGLMGIGVLQHGNAIEMTGGMLGIEDACSGIRSLQAALMATLFLGEYFRLSRGRRMSLVAGGALLALALNCARVLSLALLMQARGAAVEARLHDPVGDLATAATFLGVLGLTMLLGRGRKPAPEEGGGPPLPARGFDGLAACGAFAAIPLLVWLWFASIGATGVGGDLRQQWRLAYSQLAPSWEAEPFEARPGERTGLRFSTWQACRVRTPAGWNAQVIHVGWDRGASMPSLAFYHTPELCMPWVGWTETGRPEELDLPSRGGPIPCMAYRFQQDGAAIIVLQSLSSGGENGCHRIDPTHIEGRWHRLLTLLRAPMRQVNEELLVYLPDFGDRAVQSRAAAELLNAVLIRGS
jgi:exosortase